MSGSRSFVFIFLLRNGLSSLESFNISDTVLRDEGGSEARNRGTGSHFEIARPPFERETDNSDDDPASRSPLARTSQIARSLGYGPVPSERRGV